MILTASCVQELIGVADNVVVAHGYTFDRYTLDIFFQGGKVVRVISRGEREIDFSQSVIFEPTFFTNNVKRWYSHGFNERLKGLFETFGNGLSFVDGGKYPDLMFLPSKQERL